MYRLCIAPLHVMYSRQEEIVIAHHSNVKIFTSNKNKAWFTWRQEFFYTFLHVRKKNHLVILFVSNLKLTLIPLCCT